MMVAQFVQWAITDGQKFGSDFDYASLAKPLVQKAEASLKTMTCGGKSCLAKK